KTRFSRLPGFRSRESPARVTLSTNATSGRRLCGLNHIPLGLVERNVDLVPFAHRLDLVLEDPEDDHVPVAGTVKARLPQHAFLVEAVAPERVHAQHDVRIDFRLDAAHPQDADAIIGAELAGCNAVAPPDRPPCGDDAIEVRG